LLVARDISIVVL